MRAVKGYVRRRVAFVWRRLSCDVLRGLAAAPLTIPARGRKAAARKNPSHPRRILGFGLFVGWVGEAPPASAQFIPLIPRYKKGGCAMRTHLLTVGRVNQPLTLRFTRRTVCAARGGDERLHRQYARRCRPGDADDRLRACLQHPDGAGARQRALRFHPADDVHVRLPVWRFLRLHGAAADRDRRPAPDRRAAAGDR